MGVANAVIGQAEIAAVIVGGTLLLTGAARLLFSRRPRQVVNLSGRDDRPVVIINPDETDVRHGVQLVHRVLKTAGLIPAAVMSRAAQGHKFACLLIKVRGEPVGFVEVWELRRHPWTKLRKGRIAESELTDTDFREYEPSRKDVFLYVRFTVPASFSDPQSAEAKEANRLAAAAVYGFVETVREAYTAHGVRVRAAATAHTSEARDLLLQMAWHKERCLTQGRWKKTRRSMWKVDITDDYLAATKERLALNESCARVVRRQGADADRRRANGDADRSAATEDVHPAPRLQPDAHDGGGQLSTQDVPRHEA